MVGLTYTATLDNVFLRRMKVDRHYFSMLFQLKCLLKSDYSAFTMCTTIIYCFFIRNHLITQTVYLHLPPSIHLLTLQQLHHQSNLNHHSTLTINKEHGPQTWLLKTNTHVFNISPSFYVPSFICRSYEPSHKQNGTMRLQRIHSKQPIKRLKEKEILWVFIRGLLSSTEKLAGVGQPDGLYVAHTRRRFYEEHCKS